MNNFVSYDNVVPLLAPVDIASTATSTPYMDLKGAHMAAFLVQFGLVTSATAGDVEVVTVQAATAEGGTEAAIAFNYRKAAAAGANTWGAITAAAATGIEVAASVDDGVSFWIEVDPSVLAASDYRYVRVVLTDNPDMTACLTSVVGFLDPRYSMSTMVTATASASA